MHDASNAGLTATVPAAPVAAPPIVACARHQWRPDLEAGSPWLRCQRCGAKERAELRGPALPFSGKTNHRFAPTGFERRYSTVQEIAVDETTRTFEGYAVVWGVQNSHREIFERGAFKRTLGEWAAESDLPSFYLQHNWDLLIGEWTEMREDEKGLFVRGRFIKSPWGDHGLALVREKIATGLSIGFIHNDYEVENETDWKNRIVRVKEVTLFEVSLVEMPSDPAAGVTAIRADMTVREIEQVLASIPGMPPAAAKAMATRWKSKARDASDSDEASSRDVNASVTTPETEGETRDASGPNLAELILRTAETLK